MDDGNMAHTHNRILFNYKNKNEMMSFTGKWMDLGNIISNEVTKAQKDKHHMFSHMHGPMLQMSKH